MNGDEIQSGNVRGQGSHWLMQIRYLPVIWNVPLEERDYCRSLYSYDCDARQGGANVHAYVRVSANGNESANARPAFRVSSGRKFVQGHVHDDGALPLQTFRTSSPQVLTC